MFTNQVLSRVETSYSILDSLSVFNVLDGLHAQHIRQSSDNVFNGQASLKH